MRRCIGGSYCIWGARRGLSSARRRAMTRSTIRGKGQRKGEIEPPRREWDAVSMVIAGTASRMSHTFVEARCLGAKQLRQETPHGRGRRLGRHEINVGA